MHAQFIYYKRRGKAQNCMAVWFRLCMANYSIVLLKTQLIVFTMAFRKRLKNKIFSCKTEYCRLSPTMKIPKFKIGAMPKCVYTVVPIAFKG